MHVFGTFGIQLAGFQGGNQPITCHFSPFLPLQSILTEAAINFVGNHLFQYMESYVFYPNISIATETAVDINSREVSVMFVIIRSHFRRIFVL